MFQIRPTLQLSALTYFIKLWLVKCGFSRQVFELSLFVFLCLRIHPPLPPISIDLCMIYTIYDSCWQPGALAQSMWVRNSKREMKYDCIYVVLPMHFSLTSSHSVKLFARFGKCAGSAFKSTSPHFSLLHHGPL